MAGPRRSLSQFGGAVSTSGEPALAALLAQAWRAAEAEGDALTHGFHAYPARAHPALVRTLVDALSNPGELVVDPFCGSGTTLVETFAAGRRAFGSDVNGVAVALARQKTRRTTAGERSALAAAAARAAGRAAALLREDESTPPPRELRGEFDPPVWRELDALGRALDSERDPQRHLTLLLVLSSLLTKVSQRSSETDESARPRRLPPHFVIEFFAARAKELIERLAQLSAAAPRATPAPLVALADARALPLRAGAAALAVTSPPYLGTYDYGALQALRARLLGFDASAAGRREIGARDDAHERAAPRRFQRALADAFAELARVLRRDGRAVVVLGDSLAGATPVRADELTARAAAAAGLNVLAAAAQERADLPGATAGRFASPRREHLLLLAPR